MGKRELDQVYNHNKIKLCEVRLSLKGAEVDLLHAIDHPTGSALFLEYLTKQLAAENLTFYKAVDRYDNLCSSAVKLYENIEALRESNAQESAAEEVCAETQHYDSTVDFTVFPLGSSGSQFSLDTHSSLYSAKSSTTAYNSTPHLQWENSEFQLDSPKAHSLAFTSLGTTAAGEASDKHLSPTLEAASFNSTTAVVAPLLGGSSTEDRSQSIGSSVQSIDPGSCDAATSVVPHCSAPIPAIHRVMEDCAQGCGVHDQSRTNTLPVQGSGDHTLSTESVHMQEQQQPQLLQASDGSPIEEKSIDSDETEAAPYAVPALDLSCDNADKSDSGVTKRMMRIEKINTKLAILNEFILDIQAVARSIIVTYIHTDGEKQLNLPCTLRTRCLQQFERWCATTHQQDLTVLVSSPHLRPADEHQKGIDLSFAQLFLETKTEVWKILRDSLFPRWKTTIQYRNYSRSIALTAEEINAKATKAAAAAGARIPLLDHQDKGSHKMHRTDSWAVMYI